MTDFSSVSSFASFPAFAEGGRVRGVPVLPPGLRESVGASFLVCSGDVRDVEIHE